MREGAWEGEWEGEWEGVSGREDGSVCEWEYAEPVYGCSACKRLHVRRCQRPHGLSVNARAVVWTEAKSKRVFGVYVYLSYNILGRACHRVAFHWLSQPITALFARSRPIMFKRR